MASAFIRNYKIKKEKSIRFLSLKNDIEKNTPPKAPSLGERGLRGRETKGAMTPSPRPSPIKGEGEQADANVYPPVNIILSISLRGE
jgi:hypothetical protein